MDHHLDALGYYAAPISLAAMASGCDPEEAFDKILQPILEREYLWNWRELIYRRN